jgi:hypothetical protein
LVVGIAVENGILLVDHAERARAQRSIHAAFHKAVGLAAQRWAELEEAEFFANQRQIDDGLALIANALADAEELAEIRSPALRQRADLLTQSGADASAVDATYRAAIECAQPRRQVLRVAGGDALCAMAQVAGAGR